MLNSWGCPWCRCVVINAVPSLTGITINTTGTYYVVVVVVLPMQCGMYKYYLVSLCEHTGIHLKVDDEQMADHTRK